MRRLLKRSALRWVCLSILACGPATGTTAPERSLPYARAASQPVAVSSEAAAQRLAPARAVRNAHYAVLLSGAPSGHLRVGTDATGRVRAEYSYRDNGRGPDLVEHFELSASGTPIAYALSGRSTFGAELAERFDIAGGRVRWQSRVDHGDQPADARLVFVPIEASPAYTGALIAALMQRPERAASVIGGHLLSVQTLARESLTGPDGPVSLELVALTGLEPQPVYYWMRELDGRYELFGSIDPRHRVVLSGFEPHTDALLTRQAKAQDELLLQQREQLGRHLGGTTVITNVRWFDSRNARIQGPSDIWLNEGRVVGVVRPGEGRLHPDQIVDGTGRTLMPGMFNMHVHFSVEQALSHLASGVTTIREMGNHNESLIALKARIDRGEIAGPTIVPAGFIEGKSRFSSRSGFVVDTLEEARDAVDWYARKGYRLIKLYNSVKPEWVEPLAAHARRKGLRVAGHVPAFMRAEDAVRAGFDELIHINQLMLNFVSRAGDDSRTLVRFTRVGDDAHQVDLASRSARDFVRLLRDRGTTVDPTLVAFESLLTQRQGELNPSFRAIIDHLPALWQREMRQADMDLEGPKLDTYRRSFRRLLDLTRHLYEAGVPLITGTDSPFGLAMARELELYVLAGIPPARALQAATWNAARAAGETERGAIETGRISDLLLVDGDPTANISDIRRVSLVIQGRTAYKPPRLHAVLGMRPFTAPAVIQGGTAED